MIINQYTFINLLPVAQNLKTMTKHLEWKKNWLINLYAYAILLKEGGKWSTLQDISYVSWRFASDLNFKARYGLKTNIFSKSKKYPYFIN